MHENSLNGLIIVCKSFELESNNDFCCDKISITRGLFISCFLFIYDFKLISVSKHTFDPTFITQIKSSDSEHLRSVYIKALNNNLIELSKSPHTFRGYSI